jgi:hypothetical protein
MYSYTGYPENRQLWLLQLSIIVKPVHLSFFPAKERTSMQDSANQINVTVKYYLFSERKGRVKEAHELSQLRDN